MKALLLALAAALAVFADAPAKDAAVISVVAGPEISGVPDARRAGLALDLAHTALGHGQRAHPHVVLMYVDSPTARAHGLPKHADVVVVRVANGEPSEYYVWLVGEPNDERLAIAVVLVLNREWELKLGKKQIAEAAYRVRLGLAGVISASDLARDSRIPR